MILSVLFYLTDRMFLRKIEYKNQLWVKLSKLMIELKLLSLFI